MSSVNINTLLLTAYVSGRHYQGILSMILSDSNETTWPEIKLFFDH